MSTKSTLQKYIAQSLETEPAIFSIRSQALIMNFIINSNDSAKEVLDMAQFNQSLNKHIQDSREYYSYDEAKIKDISERIINQFYNTESNEENILKCLTDISGRLTDTEFDQKCFPAQESYLDSLIYSPAELSQVWIYQDKEFVDDLEKKYNLSNSIKDLNTAVRTDDYNNMIDIILNISIDIIDLQFNCQNRVFREYFKQIVDRF